MLQHGAMVNAFNQHGATPLHWVRVVACSVPLFTFTGSARSYEPESCGGLLWMWNRADISPIVVSVQPASKPTAGV
eukprot:6099496-Pyramimonas_sp.AAC.1